MSMPDATALSVSHSPPTEQPQPTVAATDTHNNNEIDLQHSLSDTESMDTVNDTDYISQEAPHNMADTLPRSKFPDY